MKSLSLWQDSKLLTLELYKATQGFPGEEKFGLVSQLRRAMILVTSNIAEGSSRISAKDQAHFYHLAFSSLMEVLRQILLSIELGYINTDSEEYFRNEISKIANKINALRKTTLKQTKP